MSKFGRAAATTASPNRFASSTSSASCAVCSAWTPNTLRKSRWMAALSSMIRIRRLARAAESGTGILRRAARQLEHECRAASRPVARHEQRAAELLGRERPAVQAEAVPVHASREAVREYPGHVFRGNSHAIVDDANAHTGRRAFYAQGEKLVGPARFIARILGVAHEIHQNLQHLVLIDGDRRHLVEFAAQRHAVTYEGAGVQAQAVLHQIGHRDGFGHAAQLGVALLHRHRVLDVFQVVAQRCELFERHFLIAHELFAERGQVLRYALAALVTGEEFADRRAFLLKQRGEAGYPRSFRLLDALGHEAGRDIDAVQDIADIVQHIGRDFGHACLARSDHELLVHPFELFRRFLAGADVAQELDRVLGLAVAFANQRRRYPNPVEAPVLADVALFKIDGLDLAAPQALEFGRYACDIVAVREVADGHVREFAGVESQHRGERVVVAQQSAAAIRVGNADRCLVEGIAEHAFRLSQVIAGVDQIRDVGNRADPAGDAVRGDHLLRKMANLAVIQGAIGESAGAGPAAEIRPGLLHARPIVRMHTTGPIVGTMHGLEPEYAAVLGVAINHVPGRVRVINGDRRAVEQGSRRYGAGVRRR